MKILGIGLTGLVGSRIAELLSSSHQFDVVSASTGCDITDSSTVERVILDSRASLVIHAAAKSNVDICEEDRKRDQEVLQLTDGQERKKLWTAKTAWAVNVWGTENVAAACRRAGKKLMYISTDFVFDGKRLDNMAYTEKDVPNPINWYGVTKYKGEIVVKDCGAPYLIVRIAFPYRASFLRPDFVRRIITLFEKGETIPAVTDQVFTPTFIDDIAYAMDALIKNEQEGIVHVVGDGWLTPFEAALSIARTFGYSDSLVRRTTREEFFKKRAPRPFFLGLGNDTIKQFISMKSFARGLSEIKHQQRMI